MKYYPDPVFEPYDSYQPVIIEDSIITIRGQNLSSGYPVSVLLDGKPVCEEQSSIQVYNFNTLLCDFELNSTDFSLSDYHAVEVEYAGKRVSIGEIYFQEKDAPPRTAKIAVWTLIILCIIGVAVVVGFLYLKREGYIFKEKQGPPPLVVHWNPPISSNDPHTPSSTSNCK